VGGRAIASEEFSGPIYITHSFGFICTYADWSCRCCTLFARYRTSTHLTHQQCVPANACFPQHWSRLSRPCSHATLKNKPSSLFDEIAYLDPAVLVLRQNSQPIVFGIRLLDGDKASVEAVAVFTSLIACGVDWVYFRKSMVLPSECRSYRVGLGGLRLSACANIAADGEERKRIRAELTVGHASACARCFVFCFCAGGLVGCISSIAACASSAVQCHIRERTRY